MASPEQPVACTLTTAEAARQTLEWEDLQQVATERSALPGGARMRFPSGLRAQVDDLVTREAACCAFLSFASTIDGDDYVVEVTSANPDAAPVIALLAGL